MINRVINNDIIQNINQQPKFVTTSQPQKSEQKYREKYSVLNV